MIQKLRTEARYFVISLELEPLIRLYPFIHSTPPKKKILFLFLIELKQLK